MSGREQEQRLQLFQGITQMNVPVNDAATSEYMVRNNEETKDILGSLANETVNIAEGVSQMVETSADNLAVSMDNKNSIRQINEQFKQMMDIISTQQQQIAKLTLTMEKGLGGVAAAVTGVGDQVTQVGKDVKVVGEDVKEVGKDVKEVGKDVKAVISNIQVLSDKTMAEFGELKSRISNASQEAQNGCLPINFSSASSVVNSILNCIWRFIVFIGIVLAETKNFYMAFRSWGLALTDLTLGSISIVGRLDVMFRLFYFFFEMCIIITLGNTIGVYFGYPKIAIETINLVIGLLVSSFWILYNFITFIVLSNPITKMMKDVLEDLGINTLFRTTMATMTAFIKAMKGFMSYFGGGSNKGKTRRSRKPRKSRKSRKSRNSRKSHRSHMNLIGGNNSVALTQLQLPVNIQSSIDTINSILDNPNTTAILDTYKGFINGIVFNIYNVVVLNIPNPELNKYILNNQNKLLNFTKHTMNIIDDGSMSNNGKSDRVEELEGGRRNHYKRSNKNRRKKTEKRKKHKRAKTRR